MRSSPRGASSFHRNVNAPHVATSHAQRLGTAPRPRPAPSPPRSKRDGGAARRTYFFRVELNLATCGVADQECRDHRRKPSAPQEGLMALVLRGGPANALSPPSRVLHCPPGVCVVVVALIRNNPHCRPGVLRRCGGSSRLADARNCSATLPSSLCRAMTTYSAVSSVVPALGDTHVAPSSSQNSPSRRSSSTPCQRNLLVTVRVAKYAVISATRLRRVCESCRVVRQGHRLTPAQLTLPWQFIGTRSPAFTNGTPLGGPAGRLHIRTPPLWT